MKLLVTGAWNCSPEQLKEIEQCGHSIVFMQNEKDELPCAYEQVEGVIGNGLFLHHPIERFTSLRFIQLTSAGFDRVPMTYVEEHNIEIFNARGVYSIPMAEFAIGGILQLYKQARFFADNQKKNTWEKHRGILELFGKTVCIVGCGSVGTACAVRLSAFGCRVIGVDVAPYESCDYAQMLPLESLDEALSMSDVVILTLPLTDKTHHLMDSERFLHMKEGAILVNIARGAVVDTPSLIAALGGKLGGAVLDVFEDEPLSLDSELWQMENVIVTPHNSFIGDGNGERLWEVIKRNLEMNG